LTKPFEKSELDAAMLKSRQKKELVAENQVLRDYCDQVTEDLSFLAASPQIGTNTPADFADCAGGRAGIRVRGERSGQRSGGAHDSSALEAQESAVYQGETARRCPGELLESELFGFEQGALPARCGPSR